MSGSDQPPPGESGFPGQRLEPEGGPTVDPEHLRALSEMGIPEPMAEKALLMTGGQSLEAAAAWYFDGGDENLVAFSASGALGNSDRMKMVFVVNEELKMGKGKIAAQVAHSCLGLYRTLLQDRAKHELSLIQWETLGETKIVLCGSNAEHLLELQRRASSASLPSYLTQDAGRTQVPAASYTVLSIFGDEKQVDQITGNLTLL